MRLTQWRDPLSFPSQGDKRGSVFYTRMTVSPFAACAP